MAWAADSTHPGFLGPSPTETLTELNWVNFLQATVAGIIGLPGNLVRPRWQPNPPPTPDVSVDWAACGITRSTANFEPYMHHYASPDPGHDVLRRQEQVNYLVSCYGPNAGDNIAILRDGIFVDQNRAGWRENAVGLVEAERITHVPELFRQQWRDRYDLEIVINREVRRVYLVRNLLRARGPIYGESQGREVETWYDTGDVTAESAPVQTKWDDGATSWDDGDTIWDFEG